MCCNGYPEGETYQVPHQGTWSTCDSCGNESRLYNDEHD